MRDRGLAGDRDVRPRSRPPSAGARSRMLGDEGLGRLVLRAAVGDDGDEGGRPVRQHGRDRVRRRRPDRRRTRRSVRRLAADLHGDRAGRLLRGGGVEVLHEHDERTVDAGPEVLADQVVGLALRWCPVPRSSCPGAPAGAAGRGGRGRAVRRGRRARSRSGRRVISRVQRSPIEPPVRGLRRRRARAGRRGSRASARAGRRRSRAAPAAGSARRGRRRARCRRRRCPSRSRNGMPTTARPAQRDDHGEAGEDDRRAGGAGRARRGLLGVHARRPAVCGAATG